MTQIKNKKLLLKLAKIIYRFVKRNRKKLFGSSSLILKLLKKNFIQFLIQVFYNHFVQNRFYFVIKNIV